MGSRVVLELTEFHCIWTKTATKFFLAYRFDDYDRILLFVIPYQHRSGRSHWQLTHVIATSFTAQVASAESYGSV